MTLGIPRETVTFEALDDAVAIDSVALLGSDQPVKCGKRSRA